MEISNPGGEGIGRERLQGNDVEPPRPQPGDVVRRDLRGGEVAERLTRRAQQRLAGRCEAHAVVQSMEQLGANLPLKRLDRLAQRRLGDV